MKAVHFISKFFLLFIIIAIYCPINSSRLFKESSELLQKRTNFINKYRPQITNNKLTFEYSKDEGFYCKASEHLSKNQFVFKVPNDMIICGCKNIFI
jgi:hypothetical protein